MTPILTTIEYPALNNLSERRIRPGDRRQFKRHAGTVVGTDYENRVQGKDKRRIPDRRINNIEAEWIDDMVINTRS